LSETTEITLYATPGAEVPPAKLMFDQHHIPYRWIDIDKDEKAAKYVESLNHGNRSVPTIVWPDGSSLTEPSTDELAKN